MLCPQPIKRSGQELRDGMSPERALGSRASLSPILPTASGLTVSGLTVVLAGAEIVFYTRHCIIKPMK